MRGYATSPVAVPQTSTDLACLDVLDLAVRWREHNDRQARDEIFIRFLPLARRLARRYWQAFQPLDDLVQVAGIGLLNAIDRFDPDRGYAFVSFAIPTILGELKRYFRNSGWSAHVPRHDKELALRVEMAIRQLSDASGRSPRVDELAQYLEISTEDVVTGLTAATAHFSVSLDKPVRGESDTPNTVLGDTLGDGADQYAFVDTAVSLGAAMRTLPHRQREVLTLRLQGNRQADIARHLGCSQMQVSRLLRDAATQLHTIMS